MAYAWAVVVHANTGESNYINLPPWTFTGLRCTSTLLTGGSASRECLSKIKSIFWTNQRRSKIVYIYIYIFNFFFSMWTRDASKHTRVLEWTRVRVWASASLYAYLRPMSELAASKPTVWPMKVKSKWPPKVPDFASVDIVIMRCSCSGTLMHSSTQMKLIRAWAQCTMNEEERQ